MRLRVLVTLFVCSGGCSKESSEFQVIEIDAIGVSVQAPGDWKLEEQGSGRYKIHAIHRALRSA